MAGTAAGGGATESCSTHNSRGSKAVAVPHDITDGTSVLDGAALVLNKSVSVHNSRGSRDAAAPHDMTPAVVTDEVPFELLRVADTCVALLLLIFRL